MARLRSTTGKPGTTVTLVTRFYVNGTLFNPNEISSITIYDAESGGNLVATLTATNTSTGVYEAPWSIPTAQSPGVYYDRWVWKAQSDMPSQTRTYSFRVLSAMYERNPRKPHSQGPLFIGPREIGFFNHINKEMIQKVISQEVTYYAVSDELTKSHKLYNEAVKKTTYRPVKINALVRYNDPIQKNDSFGIDTVYTIELYFHKTELAERNIIPREGDFVKFGEVFYSIESLVEPQIVFGQIDNKVMLKATCRVSRESQFTIGS